jgi:hypothetical protein
MGANATTSVPTYVAGQVLEAADLVVTNSGAPVFADSTARDAAFGGTGEKTLAEGQLCYLEDSNVVQYYDGSSWATVGPASAGGLVFITGASFTTQTSVSLPNDTFTATYRNYRMIWNVTGGPAGAATITGRLRASGSDSSASSYTNMNVGINSSAAADSAGSAGQTSFAYGSAYPSLNAPTLVLDVYEPKNTQQTHLLGSALSVTADGNNYVGRHIVQRFNATTAFDSFTLISSVASSMTGYYRVYGYADS